MCPRQINIISDFAPADFYRAFMFQEAFPHRFDENFAVLYFPFDCISYFQLEMSADVFRNCDLKFSSDFGPHFFSFKGAFMIDGKMANIYF